MNRLVGHRPAASRANPYGLSAAAGRWALAARPRTLRGSYLTLGSMLLVLYLTVPPFRGSTVVISLISASSAAAILIGVRRNRPAVAWPWLLFAIGQLLFFLGDLTTYVYPAVAGHEVPFPSVGDGLYLAMYPVMMLGILLIVRLRSLDGDRAGVIDALVTTLGVGLVSWVFLMAPYVHDATLGSFAKVVSIAYPLGDVLLLSAVLRLVFDGGRRPRAFFGLLAATALLFATDTAYGVALLNGTYHHQLIYDAGWIGYYLLWGSVALDPTMCDLTDRVPARERLLTRRRMALLTVASVGAPAIEIVRQLGHGETDLVVICAAAIVLFLLVILRISGLARQHERGIGRERVLRDASAAFVSAADRDGVRSAAYASALALVGDAAAVRICGATDAGGLMLVRGQEGAARPLSARATSEIEDAVERPSTALGRVARAELGLYEAGSHVALFPVIAFGHRGVLVIESEAALPPPVGEALCGLADSVSLALGRSSAIADAHRKQSEARFGSLVRNASDLITVVDLDGTISYQSPSIERILGYRAEDVLARPIFELLAPADRGRLAQVLASRSEGGAETHLFECVIAHADGRAIDFEVLATDLVDDEHVRGIVLNGRDVSERKSFEATIAHQAFHDAVTGLPNRALFTDRVQRALTRADRGHESVGVIILDIDDFKTINDGLGHSVGDEVLREIARRIASTISATDTAARFGGDEFAVLLEGASGARELAELADRLVAAFAVPVALDSQQVLVRPSLGVAIAVSGSADPPITADELVRNADAAMYICKGHGLGGYRVFEEAMHASVVERLNLRAELQRGLEERQFELHFQPLVDLQTGEASAVEALCRWNHPTRGLVQPAQFIPLAEELGLIVELGRWVLHEACWLAAGLQASVRHDPPLRLGVNLSSRQLQHPGIVDDVRSALQASGLAPETLVLEVTETVMMADMELAATRLGELRALGPRIAMDDFGTGYSSLSYLSQLPIDVLKMDRSFLSPHADVGERGIAAAIVSLGATLGLEVVAEGIEHAGQLAALRSLGCETGQGYFIGRPMDLASLEGWLRDRHSFAALQRHLAA